MERLSDCKMVQVSMNCGHIYEAHAITKWTNITGSQDAQCPACRTPIAGMWQLHVKPRTELVAAAVAGGAGSA
jgi:Anaphase-promoting complex subunit 11 RING-H2 finger